MNLWLDALSGIDEQYVEEYVKNDDALNRASAEDGNTGIRKLRRWLPVSAGILAAAAAVLVTLSAIGILPVTKDRDKTGSGMADPAVTTPFAVRTTDLSGYWKAADGQRDSDGRQELSGEMVYTETYKVTMDPAYPSFRLSRVCERESVGGVLGDAVLTGAWYNGLSGQEKRISDEDVLPAERYALKGIAEELAFAVRFEDPAAPLTADHWYVFWNTEAVPSDLSEYISWFDGGNAFRMRAGETEEGVPTNFIFDHRIIGNKMLCTTYQFGIDASVRVSAFLRDMRGRRVAVQDTDGLYADCTERLSIAMDLQKFGINLNLFILDNGYVVAEQTMAGTAEPVRYVFEISGQTAKDLFELVQGEGVQVFTSSALLQQGVTGQEE